jgi:flagellar biogenesis protein FliO
MMAFQVIGSLVLLGDRCRVMVVKIRGEELLIGVTRESISILDKLPKGNRFKDELLDA